MKRIPKVILLLLLLVLLVWLCGNILYGNQSLYRKEQHWGSFTNAEVTSSDGKYVARHASKKLAGYNVPMIVVEVYDAETGRILDNFVPARAMDFHGVCWEEGTHNIWTQSGDIGIHCYEELNGKWQLNENAVRPDSIVSKYDKK